MDKRDFADSVLDDLFRPAAFKINISLSELFDKRIQELDITKTASLEVMKIERLSLNGILEGTQRRTDFLNLAKLSRFLRVNKEEVVRLYIDALQKNFPEIAELSTSSIEFIKLNFDLAALRSAGVIDSISDFQSIEQSLTNHFGLKSIFDFRVSDVRPAFSAAKGEVKNRGSRIFWLESAIDKCKLINNPYDYDRKGLIDYFSQIRWHSLNVEEGLISIIKDLFKLGITVIYQPTMADLKLKGATFSVNNKPCVVISNYRGFYTTLWFTLLHELFHVIFDWEEIVVGQYHLSEEKPDSLTVREKEIEADYFAREYLLPKSKYEVIRPHIIDPDYVEKFARDHHFHHSFIYTFYALDRGESNRSAWAKANKMNPNFEPLLCQIGSDWKQKLSNIEWITSKRDILYN
ncbi:hypothetical protein A0256_20680 [Mucilaginibacter sp. PAMC 26640]|nr:hypothetical protein A0256_20680 [Mucilaginibacter sp. PAMC 26640]